MSSAITSTPSRPSITPCRRLCNSSGAAEIPKGIRSHLYLPNGIQNVVKSLLWLSSFTCQKPSLASMTVNILALFRLGNGSKSDSGVGAAIIFPSQEHQLVLLRLHPDSTSFQAKLIAILWVLISRR
ncbi:hypothetical protein LAZ67_10001120 [Cordylochernes scorpioides]|uniref:Uncharacterized protein n=1 Tax=Cordylochernes scorpioides TaxID=51811 RepID=A0ABY6KVM5_9ARAC|nr:hypothetical protein LAZ67_10001120 [Cordylochernes scorpioides]